MKHELYSTALQIRLLINLFVLHQRIFWNPREVESLLWHGIKKGQGEVAKVVSWNMIMLLYVGFLHVRLQMCVNIKISKKCWDYSKNFWEIKF